MSPKFLHQEFLSQKRTCFEFETNTPNVYIADFESARWLDTSLLPIESTLCDTIMTTHSSFLFDHLEKHKIKIEEAFGSPHGRAVGFTLYVEWLYDKAKGVAQMDIRYANLGRKRFNLPKIRSIRTVDLATAEVEMIIWRAENGFLI